mmetsp:Transcript_134099/g.246073  ORF Transcript_134099/g.246073 Transcript_134099/m.246073 type:complete len:708 (+) Transcript_134099:100-2223(+)
MPDVDIFNSSEFACLSNFAEGFGFWVEGTAFSPQRKWWPSAEHYFQAGKFADPELQEQIRRADEPGQAKALGRSLRPLRANWDEEKRARVREAMHLKLRAHQEPREALLAIPDGSRIVNANPVDPYFGTGEDGTGANVIGLELQELQSIFRQFPSRRLVRVKVAEIGEPCEPFWLDVDLTGASPSAVVGLVSSSLGLAPEAVEDARFLTDGGFEYMSVEDLNDAAELESFLAQNSDDCELEARLSVVAPVTLWDGLRDQFLARTDLSLLCPSLEAVERRLKDLVPLMRYAGFDYTLSLMLDGDEDKKRPLDAAAFRDAAAAAAEFADVVISSTVIVPAAPLPPLLPKPGGEREAAYVVFGRHTSLDRETLTDRVMGLIWGAALGDAVGLATEFMKKPEAVEKYPEPSKLSPASRVEDRHRSRWAQGDWTDDTDQHMLILDALVAGSGVLDQRAFACSLKRWRSEGFPELGDKSGLGIGETVNGVLEHPAYDIAPDVAADAIWRQSGCTMAANGAAMRCAASGLGYFWVDQIVEYNAVAGAAVTHADPRCAATCVAIAMLVARMLMGIDISSEEQRQTEIASIALTAGQQLRGGNTDELWKFMNITKDGLAGLDLGGGGIGYTYKPLGAGCWAFLHATNFRDAVIAITMEAGDADSNATVAGALLGARFGYSQLPREWITEVPEAQRLWLETKVDATLRLLGLVKGRE